MSNIHSKWPSSLLMTDNLTLVQLDKSCMSFSITLDAFTTFNLIAACIEILRCRLVWVLPKSLNGHRPLPTYQQYPLGWWILFPFSVFLYKVINFFYDWIHCFQGKMKTNLDGKKGAVVGDPRRNTLPFHVTLLNPLLFLLKIWCTLLQLLAGCLQLHLKHSQDQWHQLLQPDLQVSLFDFVIGFHYFSFTHSKIY